MTKDELIHQISRDFAIPDIWIEKIVDYLIDRELLILEV
jgi:hypothetical protein